MIPSDLAKNLRIALYTHLTQQCAGLPFVYENQVTRTEDRPEYAEVKMGGPLVRILPAEDSVIDLVVQVDVYARPNTTSPNNMYRVTELAGLVLAALALPIRVVPYDLCWELLSARLLPRDKVVSPSPLFCTSVLATYRFEHNFTETNLT